MSSTASPFYGCGREAGLKVWRVKDFNLVEEKDAGSFFSGDCYLILDTFKTESGLRHHVHFWLGKDTTADEAGSVAIFAAQLDDALGGGPVQFRQVQGSESPEFLRLFPRLRYLAGGYASGFRDVVAGRGEGPVRLYQVKSPNKNCVQMFEVPLKLSSLNHGDCFLLEDVGARLLWVWRGRGSNIREKARALEAAAVFKEGTSMKTCTLDDVPDDEQYTGGDVAPFFSRLGCATVPSPAEVKEAEPDAAAPAAAPAATAAKLYKVTGGGKSFEPVAAGGDAPPSQSQLAAVGQFVLNAGGCIWVWTGPDCDKPEPPLKVGGQFAAAQGLPASSLVKAVKARFEPGVFTAHFPDWQADDSAGRPRADSFGTVYGGPGKGTDEQPYNVEEAVAAMVAAAAAADGGGEGAASGAKAKGLDAAFNNLTSSKFQVWAQIGNSSLELPRQEVGQFYDGASYVVLHTYCTSRDTSDLRYAVYCWLGRHCGNLEQGRAALKAADLHKATYAGRSTLVRVEQNLEPGHFIRLFKGGMLVRKGPRPSNLGPGRSPPGVHLYQVKGEAAAAAHAVEVDATASSLSSGDCFVLERAAAVVVGAAAQEAQAQPVLLWLGRGSSAAEQEAAAAVAATLSAGGAAVERVEEGKEPAAFWEALGGKGEYAKDSARGPGGGAPRLFHLRDCSGRGLKVEVYSSFSQDTLCNDDVMLLDAGTEMFVWYGSSCKPMERPRARDVAGRYLAATGRTGKAIMVEVESGQEPPFFTCNFVGWDSAAVATIPDVYAEKVRAMSLGAAGAAAAEGNGAAGAAK
ncbi:hypothetical protein HYH02_014673 [Chlamydomonas schloesseri]|uniref:Gelsolin-like domain-containing protein n=1 Tax=Chlamydomonas schloesseri TaxID=2026947 RepID=A0A835SGY5_9CHLO|nr:hypothetical protein HYH02_014673 [Chlamydomonas schloesseri]|eukprot:KAG2427027.1 hypothetical protein HYH02_014673 [Chlamydomonas schloesseri]